MHASEHESSLIQSGTSRQRRRSPRTPLWRLRGEMSPGLYALAAAAGFLTFLLAWWGLALSGWIDRVFMPSPADVLARLSAWYAEGTLLDDMGISVYRVTAGFLLSALMALPLGLFIGTYKPVQAYFEPLMEFSRYLPAVAFVPLILLWVGIGEGAKVAVIWLGTFFQMVLMVSEDVRRVPQAQIEAAQTMGATQGETLQLVVLKAALPAIVDTLRITLGWAWTYLVVAELVAANSGLGYAILKSQRFLQTDKIFVGILLIGLLGLVMDQSFRFLHRRAFPYLYARH